MSEKIYGRKPVLEAIRSGSRGITQVYLLQGARDETSYQVEAHAKARGIPIAWETRRRLDTLAGTEHHQGVVAVAEDYRYFGLEDLLATAQGRGEPPFLVLLDEIEDPQNLGAILRSADAAGAHGVVIPKNRATEVNATVIKTSAGAAEHMKVSRVTNLNDCIRQLKEKGVWVVGSDIEATKDFHQYDYRQPVALVIGNEGKGLRRLVKENCDELVKIPMAGKMSSLNASVATALLLFEVVRQRKWGVEERETAPFSAASYRLDVPAPTFFSTPMPLTSYGPSAGSSPPESQFFRSSPDPAPQTPDEGPAEKLNIESLEDMSPPPGNDKGGGFHW